MKEAKEKNIQYYFQVMQETAQEKMAEAETVIRRNQEREKRAERLEKEAEAKLESVEEMERKAIAFERKLQELEDRAQVDLRKAQALETEANDRLELAMAKEEKSWRNEELVKKQANEAVAEQKKKLEAFVAHYENEIESRKDQYRNSAKELNQMRNQIKGKLKK
jgi:hypothetical protein